MERAERAIRKAGLISLAAMAVAVPAGYVSLPLVFDFPTALAERLPFAARASAVVFSCVLVAVMMVSTGRRFSPQDIGGSAAGPPSEKLAIRARQGVQGRSLGMSLTMVPTLLGYVLAAWLMLARWW